MFQSTFHCKIIIDFELGYYLYVYSNDVFSFRIGNYSKIIKSYSVDVINQVNN